MRRYLAWRAFLGWFTPYRLSYMAHGAVYGVIAALVIDDVVWEVALALVLIALAMVPVWVIEPLFGHSGGKHRASRRVRRG